MFFTHYCLGTQVDHYLHREAADEDCEPVQLLFESRDIAEKFRATFASHLKVFEVDPAEVVDSEYDPHSCYVYLCIDVRDGKALCLDLTHWEFFDRQQHSFKLDIDDGYEVIPLPHLQQDHVAGTDVNEEGQGASSV